MESESTPPETLCDGDCSSVFVSARSIMKQLSAAECSPEISISSFFFLFLT